MSLEASYLAAFDELKATLKERSPNIKQAISVLDLTLLDPLAPEAELIKLGENANLNQVAAVCVFPNDLQKILVTPAIKRATVVNFPGGNQTTQEVLTEINTIISNNQVEEIDYVFPYQSYLAGNETSALNQSKQAYELCHQQGLTFKVILETGALPSLESIYKISNELINQGCDFLKTSTGKITQGATLSSAFTILKAIKDNNLNCGLKVSGGVKKTEQAFSYMALAEQLLGIQVDKSWFRIGASSLLAELVNNQPSY